MTDIEIQRTRLSTDCVIITRTKELEGLVNMKCLWYNIPQERRYMNGI